MEAINYSTFRKNLSGTMDRVERDRVPVLITRQSGTPAVLISLDEYNAYMETAHLSSSAKNAAKLNRSIEQFEKGRGVTHDLLSYR